MNVVVGSKNPTKLASVKQAFDRYFDSQVIDYQTLETDSGVSEQPLSVEETIQGALNRAVNAAQAVTADFSVGIEGGISFYTMNGHEYGVEISWVCVRDCTSGQSEIASSAGFPVFPKVVAHIKQGKTLSDAMAEEYGMQQLGQKNGYIGWLSDDEITRQSSNFEAVFLALGSLMKEAQS